MYRIIAANIQTIKSVAKGKKKRICLPVQGPQVPSLAGKDSTCYRATKPVFCNRRSHRNEKPGNYNEGWLLLATTRAFLSKAMKTQYSQK